MNTETITNVGLGTFSGRIDGLLKATVRQRMEAIRAVVAQRQMEDPEDTLMLLGMLSLLATVGYCAVPEHIYEATAYVIIEFEALNRDTNRDPGERA